MMPQGEIDFSPVYKIAEALVSLGIQHYDQSSNEEALCLLEAAAAMCTSSSYEAHVRASRLLKVGLESLTSTVSPSRRQDERCADLYLEDECDNGPRVLRRPVKPAFSDPFLVEICIVFNKALICQELCRYTDAKKLYHSVLASINAHLATPWGNHAQTLFELGMRSENNLGFINYCEGLECMALENFESSLLFARNLVELTSSCQLEYGDVLSNLCRVAWMLGNVSEQLYLKLQEILQIRSSLLPSDHPDVAASHYNLAMADYAMQRSGAALPSIVTYLEICKRNTQHGENGLDPIPGLIYLVLIENEDKRDRESQDLVRALRSLQEKRQDVGPNSSEVAAVLNYVGTLLCHKKEFEMSLVFFHEELRLEAELANGTEDVSTSVTCNNIGRILQEMGKYHEAIDFYQRALRSEYGDISDLRLSGKTASQQNSRLVRRFQSDATNASSSNLYSTVWYNLGLIHDKLGSYDDAIFAFEMSLELRREMLGADHPDIACLLYNIGVLRMEHQQLDEASCCFREALRVRRIGTAGQLNDGHVVKTLENLSSLHKAKGNIKASLEVLGEVLAIQEGSPDFEGRRRLICTGTTLRAIAELHHAVGDMGAAMGLVRDSADRLRQAAAYVSVLEGNEYVPLMEQLSCSLLLWGSLQYELGEPIQAQTILEEATRILILANETYPSHSLAALCEVTRMLAAGQCAAVA